MQGWELEYLMWVLVLQLGIIVNFFSSTVFFKSPSLCTSQGHTATTGETNTCKGTIIISDLLHSPAATGKMVCLGPAEMGVGDSSQPEQVSLPSKAKYK